jgi:Alpha/beta hydrolase domain
VARVCADGLADRGKVVWLATESDAQWSGGTERGDNPGHRTVEIAGVSHIPVFLGDFRTYGHPTQNPVSYQSVFRAALVNLEEWLDGKESPPSVAIELSAMPMNLDWCCGAVKKAVRDGSMQTGGVHYAATAVVPLSLLIFTEVE